ncbi:hypothetical protein ASPACDRAFT_40769 [Aspergillus aculeatus ATCC 16872]|uniref:Transcription factor domain-containing protein n=1 Tax=Aspergillus aculeatus (strain ATCC 16872 / CBS 172.66 / WB 5094) TaxID=690307 RepID=A0A1L9X0B0_ASPA1|nr:uncharacterized protein ASPACDRAFT_40769 [Aspergillus aculeatus ATCC 16872]OJK01952.1 hypothetical protein ASPACDRAFT_40769 [Aspergillus aculeatus ATCC 16872]
MTAIECEYPARTPRDARRRSKQVDALTSQSITLDVPNETVNADCVFETSDDVAMYAENELGVSNLDLEFLDRILLGADHATPGPSNLLEPMIDTEIGQYPSPESLPEAVSSRIPMEQKQLTPSLSISVAPAQDIRSLLQRPRLNVGAQRTASLILHTLRSYPQMMLRDSILPPFIHPHLIRLDTESETMEPLTNCISMVHMTSGPVRGNRKLFWKNVHWECERLYAEHAKLNKWQLLAAMQALSIYIIMRLEEGETEHNNVDFLLLSTVTVIARQVGESSFTTNTEEEGKSDHACVSWNDWLFEESRQRLCVIYQVVGMLVYFDPAAMCEHPTDLVLSPLPARRQLWEAGDELAWNAEAKRGPAFSEEYGMAANGDLVQLSVNEVYCQDTVALQRPASAREAATWEDWCSGMDGLGGLVMLAASLVG